ncbi:conserved protein of unknown function (plasmid) [Rhodovastum atsumiense]|uniref:Uncharacterized protein n=1 Tax=Rhodovastum atsumiense TaxID=504468 RepID=A0A5M6IU99_9PROT|nr:hypothetical protein [Rhodovastum atsumiense]KAA5611801.1 hypothetical protein F1189_12230 [Rhodovastum atsumiense]CAH2606091.1 conserved protein of unknown function [Rhodovastum atsumiense]
MLTADLAGANAPARPVAPTPVRQKPPRPEKATVETSSVIYKARGIGICVCISPCSEEAVTMFRGGGITLGIIPITAGYIWLLRTGIGSLAIPYSPCRVAYGLHTLPWANPYVSPTVSISVMDGRGVIRSAMRMPLSTQFVRAVEAAHAQAVEAGSVSRARWDGEVAAYHRRYPRAETAFAHAAAVCSAA